MRGALLRARRALPRAPQHLRVDVERALYWTVVRATRAPEALTFLNEGRPLIWHSAAKQDGTGVSTMCPHLGKARA
eukprot:2586038-Pyramimonas_sp.AAC.1